LNKDLIAIAIDVADVPCKKRKKEIESVIEMISTKFFLGPRSNELLLFLQEGKCFHAGNYYLHEAEEKFQKLKSLFFLNSRSISPAGSKSLETRLCELIPIVRLHIKGGNVKISLLYR
jgi:hypothetical protein